MHKIMYLFIALAFGLIVFGCLTTGNIDWEIKGNKNETIQEVYND